MISGFYFFIFFRSFTNSHQHVLWCFFDYSFLNIFDIVWFMFSPFSRRKIPQSSSVRERVPAESIRLTRLWPSWIASRKVPSHRFTSMCWSFLFYKKPFPTLAWDTKPQDIRFNGKTTRRSVFASHISLVAIDFMVWIRVGSSHFIETLLSF